MEVLVNMVLGAVFGLVVGVSAGFALGRKDSGAEPAAVKPPDPGTCAGCGHHQSYHDTRERGGCRHFISSGTHHCNCVVFMSPEPQDARPNA